VVTASIAGVVLITPVVHGDERGQFVETYRREWLPDAREMVQGNRSDKSRGAVVGLHFHRHQADYWYVPRGRARVVLHDLRTGSPTECATMAFDLDDREHRGVWIPPGVAHGFAALTDVTMTYLVDRYYDPADELGVAWDDPSIAGDWGLSPGSQVVLSPRDRANPSRAALVGSGALPVFGTE
jgi:dTDP-4-dehydrorhamnose 3,5-epimerase